MNDMSNRRLIQSCISGGYVTLQLQLLFPLLSWQKYFFLLSISPPTPLFVVKCGLILGSWVRAPSCAHTFFVQIEYNIFKNHPLFQLSTFQIDYNCFIVSAFFQALDRSFVGKKENEKNVYWPSRNRTYAVSKIRQLSNNTSCSNEIHLNKP